MTHLRIFTRKEHNPNEKQEENEKKPKNVQNPTITQPRSTNTTYVDPIDSTCFNACCDVNSYSLSFLFRI